jgi:hypothetical protein
MRPVSARAARNELVIGPNITTETHSLESDLLRRSHRGRNIALGLTFSLLVVAGAGYWWWSEQGHRLFAAQSRGESSAPDSPASPSAAIPQDRVQDRVHDRALPIVAATNSDRSNGAAAPAAEKPAVAAGAGDRIATIAAPAVGGAVAPAAPGGQAGARGRSPLTPLAPTSPARGGHGATEVTKAGATVSGAASYDRLVAEADRLLEHGKSAKADKLYAQALAARPDGVAALTGAAYVLLDRQRHLKAIETFRQALSIQPTFGPALFGIAESYRARGDTAQALGAYRQYLAIAPTGTDAPAARRQVKDLESAGGGPPAGDRSSVEGPATEPEP